MPNPKLIDLEGLSEFKTKMEEISLDLGETSTTAYRGDRGAEAYAAAVTNKTSTATENSGNLMTSGGVYTVAAGKADKASTVSTVAYDSTNKKITKTINGTTSDVVTVSAIKSDLGSFTWGDLRDSKDGIIDGTQTSGSLQLSKPAYSDPVDIGVINANMDTVDQNVSAIKDWQPTGNGTSGQVLRSNGDGTTQWTSVATTQEISDAVEDWMTDHVGQNETIQLDDSLTQTAQAAQSKAAGDLIKVSSSQPSESSNKLWINTANPTETQVPTYDEFKTLKSAINNNTAELSDVIGILQHPISFANSDVSTTEYFTTIISNVQMVKGVVYDITATLETATTQDSYLVLYKGETSVQSTTLAAGNTTATFYITPSESGDDYSVRFASGAYATPLVVSATVAPRSHGSVIDDIISEQDTIAERQALNSTIINNATTKRYYSANMYDGEYVANQYVNKDGFVGNSYSYGYTKNLIRVDEGNNITIGDGGDIRTMRFVTAYGADYEPISAKGAESVNAYAVPSGVKYIRISAAIGYFQGDYFTVQNSAALLPYDTYNAEDVPIDSRTYHDKHFVVSSNLFDGEYISGKGIKQDGTLFSDNNYGVTKNFIPVDAGDDIVATSNNGIRFMRYIAAYDENYHVLSDKGVSSGTYSYWTVPDGVYYIKVTSPASVISANDYAIYRSKGVVFDSPDTFNIVETNNRDLLRMKHEPLRLMPDYITDTLSYRPIGSLSKGYICMITDDGTAGLASYTIPLAISENIPMTFAVMKGSEVFADASMTATVLDAVNNHNCSLAQHGGTLWDLMSEIDLNNFFDDEKAYFDTLGVELRGAVIPQHRTSSLVKAVAGARFGVVRSGYTGLGPSSDGDVDNGSIRNYYDYYTSGARSNIYGLSSYNCAYASIAYNHAAVDYAKANNKIMVVYFHEFDTYAEQQAVVEDLISYAKSIGLEFITLGDIPSLETWEGVTS